MWDYILTQAKLQVAVGSGLATTPIWVSIVENTTRISGSIAAVAGAIIAVHGVWKIYQEYRSKTK